MRWGKGNGFRSVTIFFSCYLLCLLVQQYVLARVALDGMTGVKGGPWHRSPVRVVPFSVTKQGTLPFDYCTTYKK